MVCLILQQSVSHSPSKDKVYRKLNFFKSSSIAESDEKCCPNDNRIPVNLPPLKMNCNAKHNNQLTSPVSSEGGSSGHGDKPGLDISILRYKARLVKNSRLMAKRLLPSRHRNRTSFNQKTPNHRQVDNGNAVFA